MSPFVIPIFITHQGCPHRCIFCNQHDITGRDDDAGLKVGAVAVRDEILEHLARPRRSDREVQVAFYGGSFTGLPEDRQAELLGAVRPFIEQGMVASIRLSTRPDYISPETPSFLHAHGVRIVEVGIQSMDMRVLQATGRGHTAKQAEDAVLSLREAGFVVGGQLMVGLPAETTVGLIGGARRLARLQPDFVRIYPTLILKGSGLAQHYADGRYRPLSLCRAVALSARMKEIFDRHSIRVVRMGLQPSDSLEKSLVAGPYHPAFGELVLSRSIFRKTRALLALRPERDGRTRTLSVAAADQSVFRGGQNACMKRLTGLGLLDDVEVAFDPGQPRQTVRLLEV